MNTTTDAASSTSTHVPLASSSANGRITWLRHNRVDLALHLLRDAIDPAVRPLLLLHGLGEASPPSVPSWVEWAGAIHALDFTGHGASTVPAGGGYQSEMLLADADHALAALLDDGDAGNDVPGGEDDALRDAETSTPTPPHRDDAPHDADADPGHEDLVRGDAIGAGGSSTHDAITIVGRGLGAYVALQLAGARAAQVHGAILLDGPGLAGGATGPSSMSYTHVPESDLGRSPDPYALIELSRELRPADYATSFVRLANAGSTAPNPIVVCSTFRPRWLTAVADAPGVADTSLSDAFRLVV